MGSELSGVRGPCFLLRREVSVPQGGLTWFGNELMMIRTETSRKPIKEARR